MKAAVITGPHQVELRQIERPVPESGEALVKIEAVGVCGSDLHAYEGSQPFFEYPEMGGHEFVGTVVEVVDGKAPELIGRPQPRTPVEGSRVVVDPSMPCADCYPCRSGRYNCCENMRVMGVHAPGAFAEYIAAPLGCLHVISDEVSDDAAVMVEPLSIGVQAASRARITIDDTVLIVGAGTIGLSVLQVAKSRGARCAITDLVPGRLALARELGADLALDPSEVELRAALTDGFAPSGPSVVIEAVGRPVTVKQALDVVAASGRVVMLGLCSDEICFEGSLMVKKELDFLGSRLHGGTVPQAIELVESGEAHPERLVTHHMSLDEVEEAFKLMLKEPDTTIKVILRP